MPQAEPKKKVVYLLGAGATHAELSNLLPGLTDEEKVQRKFGLLISEVSRRVINRVSHNPGYLKGLELVTGTSGSLNIELLISLIENSEIHQWDQKTRLLKSLVQEDI